MWWVAVPLIAGWVVGGKSRPNTPVKKLKTLGPRTGIEWKVDDLTAAGIIIVSGHGATVVLKREPKGQGFSEQKASGNTQAVRAIRMDFNIEGA